VYTGVAAILVVAIAMLAVATLVVDMVVAAAATLWSR
jgi:hypothetical protein